MFARIAITRVSRMPARELVRLKLLGLVALASLGFSAAPLAAECPDPLPENATAEQFMACLKDLKKQVVPTGAVIAFTRPCAELGDDWSSYDEAGARVVVGANTPKHHYRSVHRNAENQLVYGEWTDLPPYSLLDKGGEPEHKPRIEEMPEHDHGVQLSAGSSAGFVDSSKFEERTDRNAPRVEKSGRRHPYATNVFVTTTKRGASTPASINNMPPYIALYFCKKD